MKIGIMGGTFDPIHNGHLMLGQAAYEAANLDQVWFMPNGNPPHKNSSSMESEVEDRIRMTELAIRPFPQFKLELYETECTKISYSYLTMEYMTKEYPKDEFYFILGADSLFTIELWKYPEKFFRTCTVLATYRDDINTMEKMNKQIRYLTEKYDAKIELFSTSPVKVASHKLREEVKKGRSISDYVPEEVETYILSHHLYQKH
ncbi:nicotinate-nucleotide adenylyltransferase [Faecalicatena contorta]|uniref:nicotinate-nucleotide adenylyltransferase n=1 Tax=Faecalicatena contorta TaxID=39482 RepID=UPI001F48818E|nr:nicotinate-nucleotide adenylyltransferase [Faecalicatena contorta]MCF2682755.1 nicotinate (nicotinamide) nucleotide adenylyltransferase [Faecalicatena contorta]